jgi:pimeloyl-ACP methyl ester carboxylesterase
MIHYGILHRERENEIAACREPSKPDGFGPDGAVSEIKVPTLIIVGEADIPDVQARTRVIQEGIAGSRCIVLTQSGHLAHFEVPEIFNRVVLKFLKSIE